MMDNLNEANCHYCGEKLPHEKCSEARKKPEPTELTELARRFLPPEEIFNDIDLYDLSEKPGQLEIIAHNLCNEIDRLTAELEVKDEKIESLDGICEAREEKRLKLQDENAKLRETLEAISAHEDDLHKCGIGYDNYVDRKVKQALIGESDGNSKTNQRI